MPRVVLVTGASRSLGASIAKTFLENNDVVYVNYNKSQKEALALCNGYKNAIPIKCDVANELEVANMIMKIKEENNHLDIIINNAEKVNLTRNKLNNKMYYNHSQYQGGLRERTAKEMIEKYPVEMVERAVKGMLPHNRLGRQMYKKLFVYAGSEHKHEAQKPEVLEMK